MAFTDIIRTVFEFAAVALLIYGFINEKKVIAFEVKLARAIRIHLRNRRIRKQRELAASMAQPCVQSRAPADIPEQAEIVPFGKTRIRNFYVA